MAARKANAGRKTKKKAEAGQSWHLPEGAPALILALVAIFILVLSLWQGDTGWIGGLLRPGLLELFGIASPLLGIWLFIYSLGLLLPGRDIDKRFSALGFVLLQVTVQMGTSAWAVQRGLNLSDREIYRGYGGLLGVWLDGLVRRFVGPIGLWLILALLALLTVSLLTRKPPLLLLHLMGVTAKKTIPSRERRQKMVDQGKVIWQHTREVAEVAVDKAVGSLQSVVEERSVESEERQAQLIALATEGLHDLSSSQVPDVKARPSAAEPIAAADRPVIRSAASEQPVPQRLPFTTEGEWWMPKTRLVPDDEVVLPQLSEDEMQAQSLDESFDAAKTADPFDIFPSEPQRAAAAPTDVVFPTLKSLTSATAETLLAPPIIPQLAPEPIKPSPAANNLVPSLIAPALSELEPLGEGELQLFYEEEFGEEAAVEEPFDKRDDELVPKVKKPVVTASQVSCYQPPPLSLLARPAVNRGLSREELEANARQLEQTLEMFGVKAKVVEISQGPTVTRYELQLAPGIRVNKVANLADDIALSLAAMGVRIEAPIPGKAAIGIEVPNKETQTVMLSEILSSKEFLEAKAPLTAALGKDIAGQPIVADLSRMPHLLIAGTTGSGKSVCMNTLICSILYRCGPEQVRMIMVDPKVVEMLNYNGIPHLLAPVVTDPKKAAGVLKIATKEMDQRYEQFASLAVKNIGQYNEKILAEDLDLPVLPYWLIFIDELADLMMIAKEDVEHSITRISQLARAAGIHMIIGTQRPTTDVVTGIIKGNVPSRIAFAVSSGIDSRIILDSTGAEKLIGRGDMLFQPIGSFKPLRVQGAYISETEVDAVVAHVKTQGVPVYDMNIILGSEESEEEATDISDRDPLFLQAAELVVEARLGSTSYLQRRLSVGYSRAGRIMDQLQEQGIVGPPKGSKSRDVLISREQLDHIK